VIRRGLYAIFEIPFFFVENISLPEIATVATLFGKGLKATNCDYPLA
jgi:hypothetical protein